MKNMLTGERQTTAVASHSDKSKIYNKADCPFSGSPPFYILSAFTLTIKSICVSIKSEDNIRRF